jgi:hypothetical protein
MGTHPAALLTALAVFGILMAILFEQSLGAAAPVLLICGVAGLCVGGSLLYRTVRLERARRDHVRGRRSRRH